MPKTLTIEKISNEFIPAVAALAAKLSPSNLSEEDRRKGFLLPYTEAQYREFARRAEHFYILRDGKQVVGFVLAHSNELSHLFEEEVYLYIQSRQTRPFLVVRQIGVAPEFKNRGYGRMLYAFLSKRVEKDIARYPMMIGFIWKRPPNTASEKFHRALGWKELETYHLRSGDGVVGIWARTIGPANPKTL